MATLSEALSVALAHHQAGRLGLAQEIYRRILAVEPNQADALHLWGVMAHQVGQHAVAVDQIGRAIAISPSIADFHSNLGEAYRALGRLDEAIGCYRRALELDPQMVEAHSNLGIALAGQGHREEAVASFRKVLALKPDHATALHNLGSLLKEAGDLDEAEACLRRALQWKPDLADAHNSLGNVLKQRGRLDEAVDCYRRALELNPQFAEAHNNLGNALARRGRIVDAAACYCRAIELKPELAEAHNNLGNIRKDQGRLDESLACFGRALELNPRFAEAHSNLGNVLARQGKLDDALACHRRAIDLRPDFAEAHSNLGNALKDQGELDEALACYRHALALKPDFAEAHSNLVYTLQFCPDLDPRTIYEEHRLWAQRHAAPLASSIEPHTNDRSPDRRLRIGYVSPDFRAHAVGQFLLPLLESHDHDRFEILCYSSVEIPDAITDRCRAEVDLWRDVSGLSDEQLAALVRQDRIDVLVDLTMHMAGSRLRVFARKPAPVQVSYLAYCGTTGLDAIDYRLTDSFLDPPGSEEGIYSEESIRLPETYWCYRPIAEFPELDGLPAIRNGHVTFGCLNNFCKVTEPTLAAWGKLLQATARSRLLLHAHQGSHRDRVRGMLAQQGVGPERLEFVDHVPTEAYFRNCQRMDIALDPFPYGGGTTTCDALWMGVPVVSVAGRTAVGRGGLSILPNVGLAELVARDTDEYVRIAVKLANDLPRLATLRATLRDRMRTSPLMDGPRFARNVEKAYRQMWQRWCETRS